MEEMEITKVEEGKTYYSFNTGKVKVLRIKGKQFKGVDELGVVMAYDLDKVWIESETQLQEIEACFDTSVFIEDLLTKIKVKDRVSNEEAAKEIGISRSTLWRLINGSKIDFDTFLKCLFWMKTDFYRYANKKQY